MKGPVRDSSTFSFNATAKTITFSAPIPASQQQILAVLNVTRNAWLYLPTNAAYGGTWSSPVLTVTASTTGHANGDVLQIFVDDGLSATTSQETSALSLTSLDSKTPSKGAATVANSTPVNIASDQPAVSVFQSAGFRENILYREGEPCNVFFNNASSPVAVATGSANSVITGTNQSLIGKCYFVDTVTASLNQPALAQVGLATSIPVVGGSGNNWQFLASANTPIVIPANIISRAFGSTSGNVTSWGLNVRNNLTPGSVSYIGSINVAGWRFTDDLDFNAPKVAMFVGDSLLNGTGPTTTAKMYPFIFKSYLASQGQRVRICLKSLSGTKAADHELFRASGWHDIAQADLIVYALGVNDAGASVSGSSFVADLTRFWDWAKVRYPTAKMIVLGVPPIENNTSESAAASIRTAVSAWVTSVNSSRLAYINLGGSFDRTLGATVYASSDTAGQRVHPNDTGHASMAATLQTGWASLGWTV
jgi:lysophospholipase L1-like esterase